MIRGRNRRLALGLAMGLAAVGLVSTTQPASAATLSGYDISWPQCSVAQGGFGNPMPPTTTGFVVIGLTDGHPFSDNPCLADQLAWATTNHVKAAPYTMSGFPTAAQITTYGASGPWSSATRAGQLSNAGYAEAVDLRQGLTSVGWAPTEVWVDVEPLSSQPWATTTAAHRENRFVLEGLMRGLHDGGLAYGLYSNLNGWQTITGTWRLPGVPAWATSGPSSSATALAKCSAPAVSAGQGLSVAVVGHAVRLRPRLQPLRFRRPAPSRVDAVQLDRGLQRGLEQRPVGPGALDRRPAPVSRDRHRRSGQRGANRHGLERV